MPVSRGDLSDFFAIKDCFLDKESETEHCITAMRFLLAKCEVGRLPEHDEVPTLSIPA